MASCKECLSELPCSKDLQKMYHNKAERCPFFKNKAEYAEVKHGYDTGESCMFHCSECGYGVDDIFQSDERNYPVGEFNFCPHCGAKMDAKRKKDFKE